MILLYTNHRHSKINFLCSYRNTVEEIVKFVTILKTEAVGFEPTNAINVGCFQDNCHKPLGHASNRRFNESQNPNALLCVGVLPLARQYLVKREHLIFVLSV